MEDVIFYLIVAGAVIVNIVRNYQKITKENKERDMSKPLVPPRTETPATSSGQGQSPKRTDTPASKPILKQETQKKERPLVEKSRPTVFSYDIDYAAFDIAESLEATQVDYEKHDISRITHFDEPMAIISDIVVENTPIDLQLDTQEDMKRAFVHSLIFERKY